MSATRMPTVSTRAVMSGRRPRRARLFASPRRRVHASAVPTRSRTLSRPGSPLVAYESVLASSPLLTKCVTSGVGFAVADAVAQSLSGGFRDANRTAANAAFGLALYGPLSSAWYGAGRARPPDSPNGAAAVAAKTALDQLLWAPVLVTGLFAWDMARKGEPLVVARERREGKPLKPPRSFLPKPDTETKRERSCRRPRRELEDDLLDTLKVNWTFWPAFPPPELPVRRAARRMIPYINAVQVLYNVFLVLKAAKRGNAKDASGGRVSEAPANESRYFTCLRARASRRTTLPRAARRVLVDSTRYVVYL